MLNSFLYIIAFIIGTLLGSFCTLAVYRIPLGKDITHERSFCVNCNHRLEFLDLIPVLSYIVLKGKCRYCGQKIRPRYFILEIFFGLTYLLFIMSLNINLLYIDVLDLIYILIATMYLVSLFLIAGIDKENVNINRKVLYFGIAIICLYIVYLYIIKVSIYKYAIYLILTIILAIIEYFYYKKYKNYNYKLQLLVLTLFMLAFTGEKIMLFTAIFTIITIFVVKFIKNKKHKENAISIGFYMCSFNIFFMIINNFTILLR